jgi:hypothetical protein
VNQTRTIYRLLTGPDDGEFCRRVTEALGEGWILFGPPGITYDTKAGRVICAQAITKDIAAAAYDPARDPGSY